MPQEGRIRYQFKDFGKRALGIMGPLESLGFVVSSASIAKSWFLPLGSLQEKTRIQYPLRAATREGPGGFGELFRSHRPDNKRGDRRGPLGVW